MPRKTKAENIYLSATYESSHRDSILKQMQIIGIPGENQNGEYILSDLMYRFFDDTIARPIFAQSRQISNLDWKKLKIWLFATEEDDDSLEYQIPELDNRDLKIKSNIPESNLNCIYVLDDDLSGKEYQRWKKTAQNIFTPLFRKFVAAPELPQLPFNVPFLESLDSKLDPYAKMKRELFFDGLIIQID
ncbi:MAG: hypothetical protein AAGF26_16450 [Cyanobacteria bacterium P01_G01_bin.49]